MASAKDEFNQNGIVGFTNSGRKIIDDFVSHVIKDHCKHLIGGTNQSIHFDAACGTTQSSLFYQKQDINLINTRTFTARESWNYIDTQQIKANNVSNWGINQYLISGGTNIDNKTLIQKEINSSIGKQIAKIRDILNEVSGLTMPLGELDPIIGSMISFSDTSSASSYKLKQLNDFFDGFEQLYTEAKQEIDQIQNILQANHRPVTSLSLAANGLIAEVFSDPKLVVANQRENISPQAKLYMMPGIPLSPIDESMPNWNDNPKKGEYPVHSNIPGIGLKTVTEKKYIRFSPAEYPYGSPYENTPYIPETMESFIVSTPENMVMTLDQHSGKMYYSASILFNYNSNSSEEESFSGSSIRYFPEVVINCTTAPDKIGGTLRVTDNEVEVMANVVNIVTVNKYDEEIAAKPPKLETSTSSTQTVKSKDERGGGFLSINNIATQLGNISGNGASCISLENGNVNVIAQSDIKFMTKRHSGILHSDSQRLFLAGGLVSMALGIEQEAYISKVSDILSDRNAILQQCELQRKRILAKIGYVRASFGENNKGFIVESDSGASSSVSQPASSAPIAISQPLQKFDVDILDYSASKPSSPSFDHFEADETLPGEMFDFEPNDESSAKQRLPSLQSHPTATFNSTLPSTFPPAPPPPILPDPILEPDSDWRRTTLYEEELK